MLALSPAQRIYLALEPVDMRKHFDGLWALASEKLQEDPFAGAWFILSPITSKPASAGHFKTSHLGGRFLLGFGEPMTSLQRSAAGSAPA